ncbi:MAG: hypothetical protein R6U50_08965 [Desulfobacterales bacterium]
MNDTQDPITDPYAPELNVSEKAETREKRMRGKAAEMVHGMERGVGRGSEKARQMMMNHTFMVAGFFIAAGFLAGLLLPETRREHQLYDEIREELEEESKRTEE